MRTPRDREVGISCRVGVGCGVVGCGDVGPRGISGGDSAKAMAGAGELTVFQQVTFGFQLLRRHFFFEKGFLL